MASDVMSVRLWLPRIKVEGVVVDAPEELVVRVCSTVRRPRCPDCGVPSGKVHDRRDNKIRDLEVSGRPVTLIWERRRLVCEPCGSRFSEGHQGFEGRVTARLARRLVKDARAMTVNAAAKRHQVSWKLVNSLVVAWAGLVGEHRRRQRCRVLLVDETSIRKRHRYVTVIVNGDTGEVLAMVPHRDTQALSGFLAAQGPRWCKAVKVVVSDGSKAYKAAIDKRLGHARHVLDRFPRHQMVRGGAHRGAPRRAAPPRGLSLNPPVWWVCVGCRVREKGLLICDDCDVRSNIRLKNRRHFLCLHHRAVRTGSQRPLIMRAWWPTRA